MPQIRLGDDRLQDFSELMELVEREENLLERMGLFDVQFGSLLTATFERTVGGTDEMYSVARGADRQVAGDDSAVTASIEIPFFALDKVTKPNEVQDFRQLGTADAPESVLNRVNRIIKRIQRGHARLHTNVMYAALNGSTYAVDKDGNPRPNLTKTFQSMFGIADADMYNATALGAKTFDLTDSALNPADEFELFRQHVVDKAGDQGDDYEIVALLGSGAFTALKNHPDYTDAFASYASEVEPLRQRLGGLKNNRVMQWQGVTYIEDISGKIPTAQGRLFPKGFEMFELMYAPADTEEHANTTATASYLFLDQERRKTVVESEVSVVAVNTRDDLVGRYTFTV